MTSLLKTTVLLLLGLASVSATPLATTSAKFTSTQYAGAVFDGVLPYNGIVASAGGTVTVPAVRLPASANHQQAYSGSAAVGMYGWQCTGVFVSAGITWTVRNSTVEYSAYLTNGSQPVIQSTVKVSQGDQVQLFAQVFGSGGTAEAEIDNLTTGQSQQVSFNVYNAPLSCNRTAQWVVIDQVASASKTPFAAFNTVNFTSASYNSFDPVNHYMNRGLTNTTAINLVNKANTVLAAGSTSSNSVVTVAFKQAS